MKANTNGALLWCFQLFDLG